MATVIVCRDVWNRIYEYYTNVEAKYPNTWDINDTLEQIDKIRWVILNFESICSWSREPIISFWKRNGWRETWHKKSPWHFAFEYKSIDGNDYILIQNVEHQDDIKESRYADKNWIMDESLRQTLSNNPNKAYPRIIESRFNVNKITITESDIRKIIKESVYRILCEEYKVTGRNEKFRWGNGTEGTAVITLRDEAGGEFRVVENDGGYELFKKIGNRYVIAPHIFPEAFNAMKKLPNLPLR